MTLQVVQSVAIAAIGYDAEAQVLEIVFRAGMRHYRYHAVPLDLWIGFVNYAQHQSYGRFFQRYILNHYDYTIVTRG